MMAEPTSIFNRVGNYFDTMRKHKGLIELEEARLDPDKIVLVDAFKLCFLGSPSEAPATHLDYLVKKYWPRYSLKFKDSALESPQYIFNIPRTRVEDRSSELLKKIDARREPSEDMLNLKATYLGLIIRRLNETSMIDFTDKAKYGSLIRVQGQVVIDFWGAVNKLDHYPVHGAKPPPDFGDREKKDAPAEEDLSLQDILSWLPPFHKPQLIPVPVRR